MQSSAQPACASDSSISWICSHSTAGRFLGASSIEPRAMLPGSPFRRVHVRETRHDATRCHAFHYRARRYRRGDDYPITIDLARAITRVPCQIATCSTSKQAFGAIATALRAKRLGWQVHHLCRTAIARHDGQGVQRNIQQCKLCHTCILNYTRLIIDADRSRSTSTTARATTACAAEPTTGSMLHTS